jgi:hypothetical protein
LALLPPTVSGPISVFNSSVRVRGQNIGATVALFVSGNPSAIGGGTASWSSQVFPLNKGIQLTSGQTITATQSQNGETSPPSPSGVAVQPRSATVGAVDCQTHIYQCGQSLFFVGLIPGASVQVSVGGTVRGRGVSADGTLLVNLSAPTLPGDMLTVSQTVGGITGPALTLAQPDVPPLTAQGQLAAPTLAGPVYACQTAFPISNIVAGALVTLTQTGGATTSSLFPNPTGMIVAPALVPGGSVTVQQTMLTGCQFGGALSSPLAVTPTAPVPSPTIAGPLYNGGQYVQLSNLIPGAQIEIFQEGESLGTATSFAPTQFFAVPALSHKKIVQATQQLCSNVSALSAGVKVGKAPALGKPAVEKPLVQCGAGVGVSNLQPGAVVYVYSTLLNAPIGIAQATGSEMDIQVAPLLNPADSIYARQQVGEQISNASKSVPVAGLPNQGTPGIMTPVLASSQSVTVGNVIAGSRVDVFVNNVFRGSATATSQSVDISLSPPPLNLGDQLSVTETTCEGTTPAPRNVTVTGCQCTQASKVPTSTPGTFLYTFNCTNTAGTTQPVQLQGTDDTSALLQAELLCGEEYGN